MSCSMLGLRPAVPAGWGLGEPTPACSGTSEGSFEAVARCLQAPPLPWGSTNSWTMQRSPLAPIPRPEGGCQLLGLCPRAVTGPTALRSRAMPPSRLKGVGDAAMEAPGVARRGTPVPRAWLWQCLVVTYIHVLVHHLSPQSAGTAQVFLLMALPHPGVAAPSPLAPVNCLF